MPLTGELFAVFVFEPFFAVFVVTFVGAGAAAGGALETIFSMSTLPGNGPGPNGGGIFGSMPFEFSYSF